MTDSAQTTRDEVEAFARRTEAHVWGLEPPDVSSAGVRRQSLIRAEVRLGYLWWNPVSEEYEATGKERVP